MLGEADQGSDGHRRATRRQCGDRRQAACPAAGEVVSMAPMERRQERLANVAEMLPTDPIGLSANIATGGGVGFQEERKTPWTKTVRTCIRVLNRR